MLAMLVGVVCDLVAGLIVAGLLAALIVAVSPARPGGQAWLWLLAVASVVVVGVARRRLVAGARRFPPAEWRRGIASRRGRKP